MVVRLGGDEFVVLLPGAPDANGAVLQRVRQALSEPMRLRGHHLQLGCSIGLASYPAVGADCKSLLKQADAAMYRAKARTKRETRRGTPALAAVPVPPPFRDTGAAALG
jgi:diguanylate cyclase (GGDEF)-like protein